MDLWRIDLSTEETLRFTQHPANDWGPRWSPDGRSIAFYSDRSGNRDVWAIPSTGGPSVQVTTNEGWDSNPDWSPDGTQLVFTSMRSGSGGIWIKAIDGGPPELVARDAFFARWSPDGQWLAFFRRTEEDPGVWWLSLTDEGVVERLLESLTVSTLSWSTDGTRIFCIQGSPRSDLWAVWPDDRRLQQMTELRGRRGSLGEFGLSVDGNYLYFTWRDDLADIWVMDVVQDDGSDD